MELSHETHISEPAVLDNSHYGLPGIPTGGGLRGPERSSSSSRIQTMERSRSSNPSPGPGPCNGLQSRCLGPAFTGSLQLEWRAGLGPGPGLRGVHAGRVFIARVAGRARRGQPGLRTIIMANQHTLRFNCGLAASNSSEPFIKAARTILKFSLNMGQH
jgi:hypothetical protein